MQSHPFRSMLWKETRELLPLAAAIAIGSTAIQFTIALISSGVRAETLTGILVAIPSALCAAFVVAAGSIMFAGEKESETIDFLRRLPTSPRLVTHSKISAAILSGLLLAAVLIPITLLITHWKGHIEYLDLSRGNWDISAVFIVFAHLLVWAMFFSILTGKVLGSILLAILISTAAQATYPYSPFILLVAFLILYSLKTRWFYDRPLFSGLLPTISISVSLPRMNFSFPTADDSRRSPRSRAALRLRWLEWQRSWGLLVCILIASLLWSITLIISEYRTKPRMLSDLYYTNVDGPIVAIPIFLLNLALLIAGISAFSSDHQKHSYRFFSERGVSPAALFWNKLLIWGSGGFALPITIFSAILLTYVLKTEQSLGTNPFSFLGDMVLICSISFTSGLLASLISRSMYVAFGLSLIFLITVLIWNTFVAGDSNGISWSLLPVPLIFLLAARIRVPDWLLERNRFRHWLKFYTLLFVPLSICAASVPLYLVYSIPYVHPVQYKKLVNEFSHGETEIRQFAAEIAIELRFVSLTTGELQSRTSRLLHEINRDFSTNPFSIWLQDLSPAERGWDRATNAETSCLEDNNWWLTRSRQISSAAASVLPEISTSSLNAIVSRKDRIAELVYIHHLYACRLASEGKLDDALDHHLRAIRISALRSRLFNDGSQPGILDSSRRALVESEALLAWSFRWLHAWALNPNQSSQGLSKALEPIKHVLGEFPSASMKSSLLALSLERDTQNWISSLGFSDFFQFPIWEQLRFHRAASILFRDEIERRAPSPQLTQSFSVKSREAYGLGPIAGYALESYSRFSSESRKMSVWRKASWELLRHGIALKSHQLKTGSFPENIQSLEPAEYDYFQSTAFDLSKLGVRTHLYPTKLREELDILLIEKWQDTGSRRVWCRLPKEVPFLFISTQPNLEFAPSPAAGLTQFRISPTLVFRRKSDLLFSSTDFILLPLVPTDFIQVPEPDQQTSTSPQTNFIQNVMTRNHPEGVVAGSRSPAPPPPTTSSDSSSKARNVTPD
ncbi:MAG: hypothetical protein KDA68_13280 [Planctomycetaceae bacterium]|nr:hypothetical protein [Planctomycetaceae bacterium]